MLGIIAGVLPFLVIISLIVTFHELGHFSVARLFKTRVERFSVGFGKILLRHRDKNGVEWCISALPLGGYVKFAGDENISSMMPSLDDLAASRALITEREGAEAVGEYFHFKPLWQRFLIVLAGPAANFVLAILVFAVVFQIVGEPFIPGKIMTVQPGSPAAAAGFQVGDAIVNVDGRDVTNDAGQAQMLISLRADTPTRFLVDRSGQKVAIFATPKRVPMEGAGDKAITRGQLGIIMDAKPEYRAINPLRALELGNNQTWQVLDTNLTYIGRILTFKENGRQIGGIVGMTKATGDITMAAAQEAGPLWLRMTNLALKYLQMMALISVSVGFLNLLPIPVLDGGHLVFYAYQSVAKKPIPMGIQNVAFRIAVVLVIGLVLFANWNDIHRLLLGGTTN